MSATDQMLLLSGGNLFDNPGLTPDSCIFNATVSFAEGRGLGRVLHSQCKVPAGYVLEFFLKFYLQICTFFCAFRHCFFGRG